MKLPKANFKVKIGPFTYDVMYSEDVTEEGDCFGSCHHDRQKIYLGPQYNKDITEQTFIHEILHCCVYVSGLTHRIETSTNKPTEEELVRPMSMYLFQIMKDNPEIF